ncbi:MAG TPA: hypothetical protein VF020_17150 [Chthoniobacterales bacterium]
MTKLGKLVATVIDGGTINRAKDPIGYVGRTRNLEKVFAGEAGEGLAVHSSRLAVVWRFWLVCWDGSDGTYRTNGTNGTI